MLPPKPPSAAPSPEDDKSDSRSPSSQPSESSTQQHGPPRKRDDAPPLPNEQPPLPSEAAPAPLPQDQPPLPVEAPPTQDSQDDGWQPVWDDGTQSYYFFNRLTNKTQWENPRLPEAAAPPMIPLAHLAAPGTTVSADLPSKPAIETYNPAIHGDYDPNASYARVHDPLLTSDAALASSDPNAPPPNDYAATAQFNRFTGRYVAENSHLTPGNFTDEAKSKRQMNAFFDVDAAANSHDGRSLREERANKKLTKNEVKRFKEKRREKKEEKRRAWLMD